jgi:predicted dinucleotide-binding enzyme
MKIGILGTGMVGNTLGTKLAELGHDVKMGSRSANNEKAAAWVKTTGKGASQGTFADAASHGEIVLNCTSGMLSLEALKQAGTQNLKGKILIDVANALDGSKGMPPVLGYVGNTSLAEEIQKAFPETKVVKSLNTINCNLMTNPNAVGGGDHDIFMSGNDAGAKQQVKELLNSFGWKDEHIIDVGDITTARGTEALMPLWIRLMGKFGSPMFQWKIVR